RKTEIYTGIIRSGAIPPRDGVRRIAAAAQEAGWTLAVASTSAEASVRSVLELAMGPELAAHFSVFAGDVVQRKKPAPDIYAFAVRRLGLDPAAVVAIEDSRNGMLAALGAGLACAVTISAYTGQEDFTGASLVVTSLGDPPPEETVTQVLSDPLGAHPGPWVELADLAVLLTTDGNTTDSTPSGPLASDPPASGPHLASGPPGSDPPASGPPASDPPASGPPASDPPASGPPGSDPPASGPHLASGPPASHPPASGPLDSGPLGPGSRRN
ncbi:HAD-IA family hydrolase, partial [Streptomyces sp. NPDC058272]|uniref:HAD-IA family hydrolase n=1 Tax=Streptomyces sp. NPDC058272 TaxID=3346415 RepID=UPI0036E5720C